MATQTASTRRRAKAKTYTPTAEAPAEEAMGNPDGEATSAATMDPDVRTEMVSRAAYFRAERRGFTGGSALQDWLEAEAEIDRLLSR
jgi:hypothetical protein